MTCDLHSDATQANAIGWLLAGLLLWLWHWSQAQQIVTRSEEEQRAVLRKVYLYAVIMQTVIVTLTSSAFFSYNLLRLWLGTNPSGNELITHAGDALLNAFIYGLFWAYHAQVIKGDAALLPQEMPRQAGIRRLYYYLVALLGLAVLVVGLTSMWRVLLDFWLGGAATSALSRQGWGDEISFFATLIITGGTVWYLTWRKLQQRTFGEVGRAELQALSRRIYLYVIVFASVITLLSAVSWLIYQLLRQLGEPLSNTLISQMSWALGATLTAGLAWTYHLRVMLTDQRTLAVVTARLKAETAPATSILPTVLILVQTSANDNLEAAYEALKNQLGAGAETEIFPSPGLSEEELSAWLRQRKIAAAVSASSEKMKV